MVPQEVAKHLKQMQQSGVIQPCSSPWSSPVVIVWKRDGTHRFCVDYRGLNAVTKPDAFPLPRISDILDQLGGVQYFSTLDLASGFWQILVDPQSPEKTAFTTPHGLFEFRVMPFGLTNAPAVFQRLMQEVLAGLNPEDGKAFVSSLHRRHFGIFANSGRTLGSPEASHGSSEESLAEVEACEMQVCERGSGAPGACPYEARSTDKSSPHRSHAGFPQTSEYPRHPKIPWFVFLLPQVYSQDCSTTTSKGVLFVWSAEC